MNVNYELYRIFYAVSKCSNITKAASNLNISQPAVTQAIKKLESQLGGVLFTRTKRGVILTQEGEQLYKYIKPAIELVENAESKFNQLKNLETGTIRIGISNTLIRQFLLPYLENFHKMFPQIYIQIDTSSVIELMPMLKSGMIDFIVLKLPFKASSDVQVISCRKMQDCFVATKNYIDLIKHPMPLCDLNNYPLILQKAPSSTRLFLDEFAYKNNTILKAEIEVTSYSLVVEFAKIGLGIGLATKDFISKELHDGTLFEIETIPSIPKREIGLAFMKNGSPSFGAKKLIEFIIKDNLKNNKNV